MLMENILFIDRFWCSSNLEACNLVWVTLRLNSPGFE